MAGSTVVRTVEWMAPLLADLKGLLTADSTAAQWVVWKDGPKVDSRVAQLAVHWAHLSAAKRADQSVVC